jgi:ribosome biogenesis GTPase
VSSLVSLGWDDFFDKQLSHDDRRFAIARVVEAHRGAWRLAGSVDHLADLGGRVRHAAATAAELPAVGDWVCASAEGQGRAVIRRVLARRTAIVRAAAGAASGPQVIAANVDTLFVVTAFTQDLNPNRIDRYVTMAWEGGATPVVLINKADLCADADAAAAALRARVPFVDVHAVSAVSDDGTLPLAPYLAPARTVALVGSSGVGKSSLVNRLLGRDTFATRPTRDGDGRGRHTTTGRHLVALPGGALLVDTPGMRELQPWGDGTALDATFEDIAALADRCRFGDCRHAGEPGCAVQEAVTAGSLPPERLESFRRLEGEAAYEARRHDKAAAAEHKRQWKQLSQAQKQLYRDRGRR